MDAADLRIFEAVARLGGMNRAAAELNTVQSNVTARIRLLEQELEAPLFYRHSRGVALTDAGRRLLPYATRLEHLLRDARSAVTDDGHPKGSLTIGALETTAQFPKVDLILRTGTTQELISDVLDRRLEGAFVCGPVDHPDLEQRHAFREELAILTSTSIQNLDALFREAELRIVVLRAGCSYRQRLEDLLAQRGILSPRRLEFGTLEAIVACVGAGLGVTLLPKSLIGAVTRDQDLSVHSLPKGQGRVDTIFIHRRDAYMSSALKAFLRRVCVSATSAVAAE
jgi:DNA-binding transcriptional LysR family regulator